MASYLLIVLLCVPAFLVMVLIISAFIGVPFLPTHRKQALTMMRLAKIQPGMQVIDLGSGAGRLLFLAAKYGAHATGYELNPFLVWWTKLLSYIKKIPVTIKQKSLYSADLGSADVVFIFLFPGPMQKLSAKLFNEMKPGSTIISYTFAIPDKEPVIKEEGIFVYKV